LFSVIATIKEASEILLASKLSLFHHTSFIVVEIASLFSWWTIHEPQLPHVECLSQQIINIVGSEIEIERIFNVMGIFTSLIKC
jgi:hypothetical protein